VSAGELTTVLEVPKEESPDLLAFLPEQPKTVRRFTPNRRLTRRSQ
jgi:hypothetical protein